MISMCTLTPRVLAWFINLDWALQTCPKLFTTCVVSSNVNVEIKRSILKADKVSFNLCNNVDEVIKREARFKGIFDHNHKIKMMAVLVIFQNWDLKISFYHSTHSLLDKCNELWCLMTTYILIIWISKNMYMKILATFHGYHFIWIYHDPSKHAIIIVHNQQHRPICTKRNLCCNCDCG